MSNDKRRIFREKNLEYLHFKRLYFINMEPLDTWRL